MNVAQNIANDPCIVLTSSSADLTLNPDDEIIAAYLYWSGSGTGDPSIKLNEIEIAPERNFELFSEQTGLPFLVRLQI